MPVQAFRPERFRTYGMLMISDNSSGNGLVGSAIDFSPLVCYTIPNQLLKGVIRFRRDMLRSDRASWILVGHVKNEEKK